jgi:hypothetical protein
MKLKPNLLRFRKVPNQKLCSDYLYRETRPPDRFSGFFMPGGKTPFFSRMLVFPLEGGIGKIAAVRMDRYNRYNRYAHSRLEIKYKKTFLPDLP